MINQITPQEIVSRCRELPASDRLPLVLLYLQQHISQAIGINPTQIQPQQPLNHLGLDSLIAVKLRNRIRTDLKIDIATIKFMEDASLADLATQINTQLTHHLSSAKESTLAETASNSDEWLEGEI